MIKTPKYTRDLLPAEFSNEYSTHIHRFQHIESETRKLFRTYAFQEIRTPIFEHTELFLRGVGIETDIVSKEMYTWIDINGDSLTLRPENTAPVIRAYVQHKMWTQSNLVKLFYIGPQFRRERGQKGRFRQFYQIGAEVIGKSDNPAIDAESIEMIMKLIAGLKISDARLLINSVGDDLCRPRMVEAIKKEIAPVLAQVCESCQRRYETNPLRILDCKVDQQFLEKLPSMSELLCEACLCHFKTFCEYLDIFGISYTVDNKLVRGLDYYTRTVFEIVSDSIGSQNALVGGGRYNKLSEMFGGPSVNGFGFAFGLDRFTMVIPEINLPDEVDIFIAYIGDATFKQALKIVSDLRSIGLIGYIDFETHSLKNSLKIANKLKAKFSLILGETELSSGQWILRSMKDGVQSMISDQNWLSQIAATCHAA